MISFYLREKKKHCADMIPAQKRRSSAGRFNL